MGRSSSNDYETLQAASALTGASTQTIKYWVKSGLVRKRKGGVDRRHLYSVEDLLALMAQKHKRRVDPVTAAATAERALLVAERADRHLRELLSVLGLDGAVLDVSEDAIRELYSQADRLAESDIRYVTSIEMLEWAKRLLKMNSQYLRLVEQATGDPKPWKPFLRLVERLLVESEGNLMREFDAPMTAALGYLDFARRVLLGSIAEIRGGAAEQPVGQRTRDHAVDELISLIYLV